MRHRPITGLASLLGMLAVAALAPPAEAAGRWVDRGITLPRFGLAFDAGLGVVHDSQLVLRPFNGPGVTGAGLNLEGSFGITSDLEIGLRTGVRLGDEAKALHADQYGRLFDTETYGTGFDTFANPEFHIRGRLVNVHVLELGLEARAYLPFETGTYFGVMAGMPIALHFGGFARLDTGIYVPIIFSSPDVATVVSIPGRLWFQATDRFWLGPITAVRIHDHPVLFDGPRKDADILIGFGLGYQLGRFADLKTDVILPRVNSPGGAQTFGFGFGLALNFD